MAFSFLVSNAVLSCCHCRFRDDDGEVMESSFAQQQFEEKRR